MHFISRRSYIVRLAALCAAWLGGGWRGDAQEEAREYQLKAINVCMLGKFVTWPASRDKPGAPFVIGVYGQDMISDALRDSVGRLRIRGREVMVKNCATPQEFAGCHVLFVGRSEENRLASILRKTSGDPILTVGESDLFLSKGGIVNLRFTGDEVRMEFNEREARRSGLVLSSGLLGLDKNR